MDVVIRITQGREPAKVRTFLAATNAFGTAQEALEALVPLPPGWHEINFEPGYCVYVAPDENNHCIHSINATQDATFIESPL